jgi:hypothetical protein
MSTNEEIGLRIENLVDGAITAGLLIMLAVLVGPVRALLGFFMLTLVLSIFIALSPKSRPQMPGSGPDAHAPISSSTGDHGK